MSSSRTCWVRTSRFHSAGSSRSIADGTMSAITRAPWLPPTTSSRNGPVGSGATYFTAAAARIAGRIGVPTAVVLPASAGSRSSTPGSEVAIALTRLDEKTVGAAEHGIGFVNDAGHAEQPCRQQRRQRRIAAEADHGGGLQPPHQIERNGGAGGEHRAGIGQRPRRAAAHGLARHHVDRVPGKQPAVAQRAGVGGEPHAKTAPDQFDAERLGRKQMAAGAARGQQDEGSSGHDVSN